MPASGFMMANKMDRFIDSGHWTGADLSIAQALDTLGGKHFITRLAPTYSHVHVVPSGVCPAPFWDSPVQDSTELAT
jgi:hypothetical protein